jgi:hypothetical protein
MVIFHQFSDRSHARALLGAPTLIRAPLYCIHTTSPTLFNYLLTQMCVFHSTRPVPPTMANTHEIWLFSAPERPHRPHRQLMFARLSPQTVAYDAGGGCCVIGMVYTKCMTENNHFSDGVLEYVYFGEIHGIIMTHARASG